MCYISVRPEPYSFQILKRNMEFIINLTNKDLLNAVDRCGMKSGKNYNKFKEMKLSPGKAKIVNAPTIKESPVNIECQVKEIIALGSHHMFISNKVAVNYNAQYLNAETGLFAYEKADLISYAFKHYYLLGNELGKYGFTSKNDNL